MDGTNPLPSFPGAGKGEGSETTVEIKIKTLDSQTYTLRVNKFVSVPALKEQIANVTGVLSEQQRLICRGKVLKDDELLSAYHVEDGHTLHLVVRQPIDSSTSLGINGANSGSTNPDTNPANRGHNLIFGAVNLSGQPSTPDLSRIFSTVISSLGGNNIDGGSVEIGSRPEQGSLSRGQTENTDSPNPSQMQVDQASTGVEFHQHQGNSQFPTSAHPTVIPDSLSTLSQYIEHMRGQFDSASSSRNSQASSVGGQASSVGDQASSVGGQVPSIAGPGLPTPAALADVALSARQLLVGQAASCLSEFAFQLQNHSTVVDGQARSHIQSHSMRSGVLFQHLGSLLLELGRTITTVRMGQTPDEAVVNAGPAIFISGSSPNPIMVQAAIGLGGSGSPHPGHVLSGGFGGGILSRNIDIRIRRGNSLPAGPNNTDTNGSESSNAQQPSGRNDSLRRVADNIFQRILQGVSSAPPSSGESTVRVVPIRTVIAIPAGVNRPPSDSSGNSDASLHPLFARIQEQLLRGQNHTRDSAGSTGGTSVAHNQHPVLDSHPRGSTLDSRDENAERDQISFPANSSIADPLASPGTDPIQHPHEIFLSSSMPTEREDGSNSNVTQQADEISMSEFLDRIGFSTTELEATIDSWRSPNGNDVSGNPERQGGSQHDNNQDGLFFASLVRHLMPYISQDSASQDSNPGSQSLLSEHASSSMEYSEGQHSVDAGNRRDPPNDNAAKRQKRE